MQNNLCEPPMLHSACHPAAAWDGVGSAAETFA